MRASLLALAASLLAGAANAQGCGQASGPAELRLAGDSAVILVPPGWARGDPATVLLGGDAFRTGCADLRVSALLDAGMLVLAMDSAEDRPARERLAGAFAVLHEGFGAGGIGALWSAAPPEQCEALLAPLSPPGFGIHRACRRAPRG